MNILPAVASARHHDPRLSLQVFDLPHILILQLKNIIVLLSSYGREFHIMWKILPNLPPSQQLDPPVSEVQLSPWLISPSHSQVPL